MKTYIFVEKNGNASLIISAKEQGEAGTYLVDIVKNPKNWRLDEVNKEE